MFLLVLKVVVMEGLVSLNVSGSTNLDIVLILKGQFLHGLPGIFHRLLFLVLVVEGIEFLDHSNDGPSILIAHTIKGKGVSYMEDNPSFHGAAPNDEQYAIAMKELGAVE